MLNKELKFCWFFLETDVSRDHVLCEEWDDALAVTVTLDVVSQSWPCCFTWHISCNAYFGQLCICAQFVCSIAADFSLNFPNRYRIVQRKTYCAMKCDVHNSKQFYCCDNLKWFLNSFFSIDCRFTMPNLFNLMNFLHVYIFIILYNLFRCEDRTWCFSGILNFFFICVIFNPLVPSPLDLSKINTCMFETGSKINF